MTSSSTADAACKDTASKVGAFTCGALEATIGSLCGYAYGMPGGACECMCQQVEERVAMPGCTRRGNIWDCSEREVEGQVAMPGCTRRGNIWDCAEREAKVGYEFDIGLLIDFYEALGCWDRCAESSCQDLCGDHPILSQSSTANAECQDTASPVGILTCGGLAAMLGDVCIYSYGKSGGACECMCQQKAVGLKINPMADKCARRSDCIIDCIADDESRRYECIKEICPKEMCDEEKVGDGDYWSAPSKDCYSFNTQCTNCRGYLDSCCHDKNCSGGKKCVAGLYSYSCA